MSFEEFLALIRASKIRISMHYRPLTGKIVCRHAYPDGFPADMCEEILHVIRENQAEIFWLLRISHIRVCYNVVAHQPYHLHAELSDGTTCMICEECARIRQLDRFTEEELLATPPIDIEEAVL